MNINPIQKRSGMGLDRCALIAALESQNAITLAGGAQIGDEKALVRVLGTFRSEQDVMGSRSQPCLSSSSCQHST